MQCPLLVLECRQITRRKATESSTTSARPGVQSDRAAASSRSARAQRVHQRRLPWHPHAYRAALRVSPASKFSERYLSFPPNFTTFGHFLKPTTTWNVLTKPSSTLLWEKHLAPSKVGLNRKRSDFSDLLNGLSIQSRESDWTFGDGRFCVHLCIETLCKRATSVAHLTNFSFKFFYKIFTEDAPPPLLYHDAKKSKMTKNSNQGGSCLNTKNYWK